MYARLLRESEGRWPAVAYFLLCGREMLTTAEHTFPRANVVVGPTAEQTWNALSAATSRAWDELRAGTLEAPGVDPHGVAIDRRDIEDHVHGDRLVLAPPCGFCNFDPLCGRALEDAAR